MSLSCVPLRTLVASSLHLRPVPPCTQPSASSVRRASLALPVLPASISRQEVRLVIRPCYRKGANVQFQCEPAQRASNKQGSATARDAAPSPQAGKVSHISCSAKGTICISDTWKISRLCRKSPAAKAMQVGHAPLGPSVLQLLPSDMATLKKTGLSNSLRCKMTKYHSN